MKIKKSLSLASMLFGISALFFYPGIIIIEVLYQIEILPLSYNILGAAAIICAALGLGLGVLSKNELDKTGKSAIISIIGITCSITMIWLFSIAAVFMILEKLNLFKIFS
jgi:ABC-type dipeptide/oligopeptide/nickel transport system permease component